MLSYVKLWDVEPSRVLNGILKLWSAVYFIVTAKLHQLPLSYYDYETYFKAPRWVGKRGEETFAPDGTESNLRSSIHQ